MTLPSSDRGVRKRDPERLDFDAVYEAHAAIVSRWVVRLGGPGVDAEDVTQEIFVIVNRRLPEFEGQSGIATWLFSITAKVVANDRRRRRTRRWWLRLAPNPGDDAPAPAPSPLERIETRERRAQFYQALDALGERHRRALVLFELEELSVAEIAALMQLRPGAVRVLLHRARAAFLKRMTADELRRALPRETGAAPDPEGER